MKSILLSALFLMMSLSTFAQNENDKKILLDSLYQPTDSDYLYYRIIKDYNLEKESYDIEEYYKSGQIMMRGKSLKRDNIVRNGEFTYYFENAAKKCVQHFLNGKPSGNYSSWYENGNRKEESEYVTLVEIFGPELKVNQFWNSSYIQTVKDGNGFYEDLDQGQLQFFKGNLVNGLKEGEWTGSDKKGKYTFKETYNAGKLISGESTTTENKKFPYTKRNELPFPKNGMTAFRNDLAQNYKMPNTAINVDGTIYLSFIVEQNGTLSNVKVTKGLGEQFDQEAVRAVKKLAKGWTPGKYRGMNFRVAYNCPIKIKSI